MDHKILFPLVGVFLLLEIAKASMRIMLSLMDAGRKIIGKKPIDVGAMQLEGFIGWLQKGYKGATQ